MPDITIRNRNDCPLKCDDGKISAEMIRKSGGKLVISTLVPAVEVTAVWHPDLATVPEMKLPWEIRFASGISHAMPLLVFMDQNSFSTCAVGLTDMVDDCLVTCEMNQETCGFEVNFTIAVAPETEPFEVFFDDRRQPLAELLQKYRDLVMPEIPVYPEAAWDAAYCSWYAVHAALTDKYLQENAAEARRLGFGTFIVDDGWCYDEYKRVNPDTVPTWYESVGDWDISKVKFPDFKAHVKRMQSLGINYMLWVAPHLLGKKSAMYQKYKEQSFSNYADSEGYYMLDMTKADCTPLVEKLRKLARDNGLDGLKIDFLDIVVPSTDNPNARKTEAFIASITDGLKQDNPNALIEFRQSYATPLMLKYGTQFRAGDAPFDWRLNFGRLVEIRLNIGNLGPVHADPAYWAKSELPHNIARHMMAMLVGVPMLSMELSTLSDVEKRLISHYVGFYRQHKDLINHGKWSVLFNQTEIAAAIVEDQQERMLILSDGYCLDETLGNCKKQTWLMNISDKCLAVKNATNVLNGECLPAPDGCIPLGGSALVIG